MTSQMDIEFEEFIQRTRVAYETLKELLKNPVEYMEEWKEDGLSVDFAETPDGVLWIYIEDYYSPIHITLWCTGDGDARGRFWTFYCGHEYSVDLYPETANRIWDWVMENYGEKLEEVIE